MATRNHHKGGRDCRNRRHQPHHHHHNHYKHLVYLLAIVCVQPAFEEDTVGVAANPQASISGAVANQAVQINQGSLSTQSFARGHFCNGPVLSLSPYFLQSESHACEPVPLTRNFGGQLTISVPLDGGAVETCKALAKVSLQKQRLDYELVRVKECINIFKSGFMINPKSPFFSICQDVMPLPSIASAKDAPLPKSSEQVSSSPLPTSSE